MVIPVSFKIYKGDQLLRVEQFTQESIRIGRQSTAHLRLDDKKASRLHCVVGVTPDGKIEIIDMGSTAGTLVNGEKTPRAFLKDGDEVLLGDTRLVISTGSPKDAEQPKEAAESTQPGAAAVTAAAAPASEAPAIEAPAPAQEMEADVSSAEEAVLEERDAEPLPAPEPSAKIVAALAEQPQAEQKAEQKKEAPVASSASPQLAALFDDISFGSKPKAFTIIPGPFVDEKPDPRVSRENRSLEVKLFWGESLLTTSHFTRMSKVTIGESQNADFYVVADVLPEAEFPLVEYVGDEYFLNFTKNMRGEFRAGDRVDQLDDIKGTKRAGAHPHMPGVFQVALPPDARALVQISGMNFKVRFVPQTSKPVTTFLEKLNYQTLNLFLISLFLHLSLLASMLLFPYDIRAYSGDILTMDSRFAKFLLEPLKKQDDLLKKLKEGREKGAAAKKHKGKEGKAGTPNTKQTGKRLAIKAIDPRDKKIAGSTGLVKLLSSSANLGAGELFGGGGLGGDLETALGGLTGVQIGESYGFGGLGTRGMGPGGGGYSDSIGISSIGTAGRGSGNYLYGSGVGDFGGHKEKAIKIGTGQPKIVGALDKEIIKRVIDRHKSQIRYCYEKELVSSPNLSGKIGMKFIIAASGTVESVEVTETSMNSANVENCISRRIKMWVFPKPKGGGIVIVNYPFVFSVSGKEAKE